jgi:serine/threonine-protein kinase HipA
MNRSADIYFGDDLCGLLEERDEGFVFAYSDSWLNSPSRHAISLTMPLSQKEYRSTVLFPFFDGLIPEGWLLQVATDNWKIQPSDRMGLLLLCCHDPVGAVSVRVHEEAKR